MRLTAIIIFLLFFGSCADEVKSVRLDSLQGKEIKPPGHPNKLILRIEGSVKCPCVLTVLLNGRKTNKTFELNKKVDEYYKTDWYDDIFGVDVSPSKCIGNEAFIKIKFMN